MTENGKTVLLVEDNEDNRIVYSTILRHFGYTVTEALNGEEGITKARTENGHAGEQRAQSQGRPAPAGPAVFPAEMLVQDVKGRECFWLLRFRRSARRLRRLVDR